MGYKLVQRNTINDTHSKCVEITIVCHSNWICMKLQNIRRAFISIQIYLK